MKLGNDNRKSKIVRLVIPDGDEANKPGNGPTVLSFQGAAKELSKSWPNSLGLMEVFP